MERRSVSVGGAALRHTLHITNDGMPWNFHGFQCSCHTADIMQRYTPYQAAPSLSVGSRSRYRHATCHKCHPLYIPYKESRDVWKHLLGVACSTSSITFMVLSNKHAADGRSSNFTLVRLPLPEHVKPPLKRRRTPGWSSGHKIAFQIHL